MTDKMKTKEKLRLYESSSANICRFCWHKEGGRCYLPPVDRESSGKSTKIVDDVDTCESFKNHFSTLSTAFTKFGFI